MCATKAHLNNSVLSCIYCILGACALFLLSCGTSVNGMSTPASVAGQEPVSGHSSGRLTAGESSDSALLRLEERLSDIKKAVQSHRRPPTDYFASPLSKDGAIPAAIAPAQFRMMHRSTSDYDSMLTYGYLRIDRNCVYLDYLYPNELRLSNPVRRVLSLPRTRTRYDDTSEEIYFLESDETVRGPFRDGDYVITGGSPRDPVDGECHGQEAFVSHGLHACDNSVRHKLCADLDYSRVFSTSQLEAQRRLNRIPELVVLLDELRKIEANRIVAWGICHGPSLGARVFLSGEADPREDAQAITEAHKDIHIMVGATDEHRNLMKTLDELAREGDGPSSITGCE